MQVAQNRQRKIMRHVGDRLSRRADDHETERWQVEPVNLASKHLRST
jgi:hypothetical protein